MREHNQQLSSPAQAAAIGIAVPYLGISAQREVPRYAGILLAARRLLRIFNSCSDLVAKIPVQLWRAFLRGCDLTAQANARFP